MEPTTVIGLTFAAYLVLLRSMGWWGDRRYGRSYAGSVTATLAAVVSLATRRVQEVVR